MMRCKQNLDFFVQIATQGETLTFFPGKDNGMVGRYHVDIELLEAPSEHSPLGFQRDGVCFKVRGVRLPAGASHLIILKSCNLRYLFPFFKKRCSFRSSRKWCEQANLFSKSDILFLSLPPREYKH